MLIRIEHEWDQIDCNTYNDEEINSILANFRHEYNKLESTYVGSIYLPFRQSCSEKAEKECKNYFSLYYDCEVNSDANE